MTDAKLIFSDNQTLTATANSTNSIDLGALVDDMGNPISEYGLEGGKIRVLAIATTALGGTSPTVQVKLQHSDNDSTYSDVLTGAHLTSAPVGTELLHITLPSDLKRYIRLNYVLGGTSPSIGVWAGLVFGTQS